MTIDLRPKIENVLVLRGDAWSIKTTISSKVAGVVTPTNLTGYTVEGQYRTNINDVTGVSLVIVPTNLATGIFHYGQAAALPGIYDVQLTPPGGGPRTYIKGEISTEPDITRA